MVSDSRARFEAWNETLPFHLDTSPYEYAKSAWQAATDVAIERLPCYYDYQADEIPCSERVYTKCPRCAALRALKGEK